MKILLLLMALLPLAAQSPVFPTRVPDDSDFGVAKDRASTTLASAITSVQTTLTLSSGTLFASNMILTIENEQIFCTTLSVATFSGCTRAFNGTTAAAHASATTVSGFITAYHFNRVKEEIKAIAGQLGAGMSYVPPGIRTSAYNFTPQAPGGSIVVGSNTFAMTPCPLGVSGSNTNPAGSHLLYLSGGSGTAEAAPITGGTCTSGAATGTITVTAANTHSGAWTAGSATAGITEAMMHSHLYIGSARIKMPSGFIDLHGKVYLKGPSSSVQSYVELSGEGDTTVLRRSAIFTSGNIIESDSTTYYSKIVLRDFTILTPGSMAGATGAGIKVKNLWSSGSLIKNVKVYNGQLGFWLDGAGGLTLDNVRFLRSEDAVGQAASTSGLYISGQPTEIFVSNSMFAPYDGSAAHAITELTNGINIEGADGVFISDTFVRAVTGVNINQVNTHALVHVYLDRIEIDPYSSRGFLIQGTSTDTSARPFSDIFIRDCHIKTYVGFGDGLQAIGVSGNPSRLVIERNNIQGSTASALYFASTVSKVRVSRNWIHTATTVDAVPVIDFDGADDIEATGNTVEAANTTATAAITVENAAGAMVSGNNFIGSFATAPLILAGTNSSYTQFGNRGLDDVVPPTLASHVSGTITLTAYPAYTLTGVETTTTIAGPNSAGRIVRFITPSGLTFDTGGNIAKSLVAAAGQIVTAYFNGTSWYIQ